MNKIKSISYELLFKILFLYIIVTIIVTGINFYIEYKNEKKQINQELKTLFISTKKSLTSSIWAMNKTQLNAEIDGMMEFPVVKGIKIVDKDSNIIINKIDKNCIECENNSEFSITKEIKYEIFEKEIFLAKLTLYSDDSVLKTRLHSNFISILVGVLFKGIFLVILFVITFNRYLANPLKNIVVQIESINLDNIGKIRISYNGKDKNELSLLSNSVNKMIEKIEDQVETLQKNELSLQKEVLKRTKELEDKNKELQYLAQTDTLTKVHNRTKLDERLIYEVERARRYIKPLGVLMIDVDHFKKVNDTFGHQVGDEILIIIANIISSSIRKIDILGR